MTDRQVHGYAPIPSVGDIALMDKNGTPYVPVSDQPGTVWNLLDNTASKANAYGYDAFGVGRSASETVPNSYRFAGLRLGSISQYYARARWYSPVPGRFSQRDVALRTQQPSYTYAGNDPVGAVDWLGMLTIGEKILARYGVRYEKGCIPLTPTWWHNVLFDRIALEDEHGEMLSVDPPRTQIDAYYDHVVQEAHAKGLLTDAWLVLSVDTENMVPVAGVQVEAGGKAFQWDSEASLDAGWWLNYSSRVSASGTIEARCQNGRAYLRNRQVKIVWHDLVDAKSFRESWGKESPIVCVLEGLTDWYADKIADAEFWVEITCDDNRPQEKRVPLPIVRDTTHGDGE